MKLPKSINNIIDDFERLPGIGHKSAQRLAFHLLKVPRDQIYKFSDDLKNFKDKTRLCESCKNVAESEDVEGVVLCEICKDDSRDKSLICVVESTLDILAIEKSGYKGLYHVLHGAINPLAGIGPDEIFLKPLFVRSKDAVILREIILATSTSLEGEATAMYISRGMKSIKLDNIKISRIGRGLPVGADLEYADENTINDAMKGRVEYS